MFTVRVFAKMVQRKIQVEQFGTGELTFFGISKGLVSDLTDGSLFGFSDFVSLRISVDKHIQPGISEKNKHMLSILASLENSCFLLFSCFKSQLEPYSEPYQTSKMKLFRK